MITIKKDFPLTSSYPLDRLGDPKQLLFFDIETTGFSALSCTVYLIGCLFRAEDGFSMIQWFAETRADEKQVIEAFFSFLSDFQTLVHFNGDMFDIPFLKQRAKALRIPAPFEALESVDIYRKIKPFKQHLKLENLKQKTIERFLSIDREDLYSGGDLIPVYQEYGKTRDNDLLHLLLLHNEDDLKGMPSLLPILFYPDFFTQTSPLNRWSRRAGKRRASC